LNAIIITFKIKIFKSFFAFRKTDIFTMVNRIIAVKTVDVKKVGNPENKRISDETKELIQTLLLERISTF